MYRVPSFVHFVAADFRGVPARHAGQRPMLGRRNADTGTRAALRGWVLVWIRATGRQHTGRVLQRDGHRNRDVTDPLRRTVQGRRAIPV